MPTEQVGAIKSAIVCTISKEGDPECVSTFPGNRAHTSGHKDEREPAVGSSDICHPVNHVYIEVPAFVTDPR